MYVVRIYGIEYKMITIGRFLRYFLLQKKCDETAACKTTDI